MLYFGFKVLYIWNFGIGDVMNFIDRGVNYMWIEVGVYIIILMVENKVSNV